MCTVFPTPGHGNMQILTHNNRGASGLWSTLAIALELTSMILIRAKLIFSLHTNRTDYSTVASS